MRVPPRVAKSGGISSGGDSGGISGGRVKSMSRCIDEEVSPMQKCAARHWAARSCTAGFTSVRPAPKNLLGLGGGGEGQQGPHGLVIRRDLCHSFKKGATNSRTREGHTHFATMFRRRFARWLVFSNVFECICIRLFDRSGIFIRLLAHIRLLLRTRPRQLLNG